MFLAYTWKCLFKETVLNFLDVQYSDIPSLYQITVHWDIWMFSWLTRPKQHMELTNGAKSLSTKFTLNRCFNSCSHQVSVV